MDPTDDSTQSPSSSPIRIVQGQNSPSPDALFSIRRPRANTIDRLVRGVNESDAAQVSDRVLAMSQSPLTEQSSPVAAAPASTPTEMSLEQDQRAAQRAARVKAYFEQRYAQGQSPSPLRPSSPNNAAMNNPMNLQSYSSPQSRQVLLRSQTAASAPPPVFKMMDAVAIRHLDESVSDDASENPINKLRMPDMPSPKQVTRFRDRLLPGRRTSTTSGDDAPFVKNQNVAIANPSPGVVASFANAAAALGDQLRNVARLGQQQQQQNHPTANESNAEDEAGSLANKRRRIRVKKSLDRWLEKHRAHQQQRLESESQRTSATFDLKSAIPKTVPEVAIATPVLHRKAKKPKKSVYSSSVATMQTAVLPVLEQTSMNTTNSLIIPLPIQEKRRWQWQQTRLELKQWQEQAHNLILSCDRVLNDAEQHEKQARDCLTMAPISSPKLYELLQQTRDVYQQSQKQYSALVHSHTLLSQQTLNTHQQTRLLSQQSNQLLQQVRQLEEKWKRQRQTLRLKDKSWDEWLYTILAWCLTLLASGAWLAGWLVRKLGLAMDWTLQDKLENAPAQRQVPLWQRRKLGVTAAIPEQEKGGNKQNKNETMEKQNKNETIESVSSLPVVEQPALISSETLPPAVNAAPIVPTPVINVNPNPSNATPAPLPAIPAVPNVKSMRRLLREPHA